jgi:hypothetical protein
MATRKKSKAKPKAVKPRTKKKKVTTRKVTKKKSPPNPTRLKEVDPDATQQVPAIDVVGEIEERMALDKLTEG